MLVIVAVAFFAWLAFTHWMRHQRRMMIHQERLALIEKGAELPPLEQEVRRGSWNVQRILLLAGLCWISIGATAFVTLSALLAHPVGPAAGIPPGIEWISLGPVGIGLAHLAVYLAEMKRES